MELQKQRDESREHACGGSTEMWRENEKGDESRCREMERTNEDERRKACRRGMKKRERERARGGKRERDEKSSARKGSRAFTQGWVQLQTQHSHPPFYGVVKCPSLLALALCPFSFFGPASPPARFAPLHPFHRTLGGWSTCVYVAPCVISFRCVAHAQKRASFSVFAAFFSSSSL